MREQHQLRDYESTNAVSELVFQCTGAEMYLPQLSGQKNISTRRSLEIFDILEGTHTKLHQGDV